MVQFSDKLLDQVLSPELSQLTVCGAAEIPPMQDFVPGLIWSYLAGAKYSHDAVPRLLFVFVRYARSADVNYRTGRNHLIAYTDSLSDRHSYPDLLAALTSFEQCIASLYQACELYQKIDVWLGSIAKKKLFEKGDGSDLQRLNEINNTIKHFTPEQALNSGAPMWITNTSLKCGRCELTFEELRVNLLAIEDVLWQTLRPD